MDYWHLTISESTSLEEEAEKEKLKEFLLLGGKALHFLAHRTNYLVQPSS